MVTNILYTVLVKIGRNRVYWESRWGDGTTDQETGWGRRKAAVMEWGIWPQRTLSQ